MILVDTNVLLDVLQDDPQWAEWSQQQLETVSLTDSLAINAVIYSELSMAFERIEDLDAVIAEASLTLAPIPREALFLAGKVFLDYRRRQGAKQGVLPDFYIGAQAAVNAWPILTRDVGRYRSYFPTVRLVAPA
ncbi:MAG: type II toxin-antitoxin system VapC family toxin [Gammaproteobacteria bacterium]|nr:MAG: type II toxin-antitoxin system VapC family toxin [Gammaproteobacteria bacterium]TLZ33019.1 MAG: type II toxin-antitoxin system VapC family toxin [Gammaproteobacteria bacterium]TLZ45929.1 MAG: type II toxin-antitoxin system VapC family toxin [Gammaproteobacteria bacterium]